MLDVLPGESPLDFPEPLVLVLLALPDEPLPLVLKVTLSSAWASPDALLVLPEVPPDELLLGELLALLDDVPLDFSVLLDEPLLGVLDELLPGELLAPLEPEPPLLESSTGSASTVSTGLSEGWLVCDDEAGFDSSTGSASTGCAGEVGAAAALELLDGLLESVATVTVDVDEPLLGAPAVAAALLRCSLCRCTSFTSAYTAPTMTTTGMMYLSKNQRSPAMS